LDHLFVCTAPGAPKAEILNRHAAVRLLRRLKAEDLQKSARHPELDHRVTVGDYVGMMSKHGLNHLQQIERLKKEAIGK
jgi:hypothetical protein